MSAEKLYVAVHEDYFLKIITSGHRAVSDWFVASCRHNEKSFEMMK